MIHFRPLTRGSDAHHRTRARSDATVAACSRDRLARDLRYPACDLDKTGLPDWMTLPIIHRARPQLGHSEIEENQSLIGRRRYR
jgi:hypothetical protein